MQWRRVSPVQVVASIGVLEVVVTVVTKYSKVIVLVVVPSDRENVSPSTMPARTWIDPVARVAVDPDFLYSNATGVVVPSLMVKPSLSAITDFLGQRMVPTEAGK
jgi:RES domain-containing protein